MDSSLKGTKGVLMLADGEATFRVYNKDKSFKDYLIRHLDLSIILDDEDATLYSSKNIDYDGVIDYSPETYGLLRTDCSIITLNEQK